MLTSKLDLDGKELCQNMETPTADCYDLYSF